MIFLTKNPNKKKFWVVVGVGGGAGVSDFFYYKSKFKNKNVFWWGKGDGWGGVE